MQAPSDEDVSVVDAGWWSVRLGTARIPDLWRRHSPAVDVRPRTVLFTDVDDLFVEHQLASRTAMRQALDVLAGRGIPVVLCSRRTRAEIERVQRALALQHPFVSENGGALHFPPGYFPFVPRGARSVAGYDVLVFARPYQDVVRALRHTASMLGVSVRGFSDMSVVEVADACGLSLPEAHSATLREYCEPFRIVNGTPALRKRFLAALRRHGLTCIAGADFYRVGAGTGTGQAIRALTALYRRTWSEVRTVGVFDGHTDTTLLRAVDTALVVMSPALDARRVLRTVPKVRITSLAGALGWKEAVLAAGTADV